ncbi:MAG: hypothetical protein GY869_00675 [Planctomycetes bacterium]|nr:hypothetical protein [Planctomycetota bacterium]
MSHKGSGGVLRMTVAFFAGVLTSLFFLVPGKSGPTILINGDQDRQIADLENAGRKLEDLSEHTLDCVYRVKDYIAERIKQQE